MKNEDASARVTELVRAGCRSDGCAPSRGVPVCSVLEPTLADIASDLDSVVTAVAGDEDFVTAVLSELHDDST